MADKERKPRSFTVTEDAETAPIGRRSDKGQKGQGEKGRVEKPPRRPRAIEPAAITVLPDDAVDAAYRVADDLTPPPPVPMKRRFAWGRLAFGAFGALLAMAVGLAVDALIRDLFARYEALGWLALSLTAIGTLAFLILTGRELWGIWRLAKLEDLRERGAIARTENNLRRARRVADEIGNLFAGRPDTARGRALLDKDRDAVMDGADLIHLVERDLLAPLDRRARNMVMQSSKRVSVVTAVSPRALIDVGFVLYENMRLIRRICAHYGGRPGTVSSLSLARQVLTHLAATGAVAVGDGLVQQVIGHGLAARLSARLGEGVVNGLLTARIGIAAIDVCRPLPFDAEKRPGVGDFLAELTRFGASAADAAKNSPDRE